MDHQERIARAEAIMESNRQDIDRMYQAISELRQLILQRTDELRSYMDGKFEAMEGKLGAMDGKIGTMDGKIGTMDGKIGTMDGKIGTMDGRFEAMDRKLDDQRKFIEDALKEVRREASINLRWMIGLTLVNTTMILGLGGKLFGMY